jgi:hypothetical protein
MRGYIHYTQNTVGRITSGPAHNPHHEQTSEKITQRTICTVFGANKHREHSATITLLIIISALCARASE